MSTSTLVTYATRHGSTQEVAEAIAAELRDCGLIVDLKAMQSVESMANYRAVVMGAPLYMFRWHKDSLNFLNKHQKALVEKPVAVFALGPFHDDEKEWQDVRQQLDKELAKFPWLKPVAIEIFGAKFDPLNLRFPYNLIPALKQMPASDIRDWEAIKKWAKSLVGNCGGG